MTTLDTSSTFNMTRTELVTEALRTIQAVGTDDTPDTLMLARAVQRLQMLIKYLQSCGIKLWTMESLTLYPTANKLSYLLGPSGGGIASCTITAGGSGYGAAPAVSFTGGGGSGAAGTAVLTGGAVTSITITNAGSGYTSRPTVAFDSGVATARAELTGVYTAARPLLIESAFVRTVSTATDAPLTYPLSRAEYDALGSKTATGVPYTYYYDLQLDNGVLYPVVAFNSSTLYTMHLTVRRALRDVDLDSYNVDVPQEWLLGLMWMLADELALAFSAPPEIRSEVAAKAQYYREQAESWDARQTNTPLQIDFVPRGYYGGYYS